MSSSFFRERARFSPVLYLVNRFSPSLFLFLSVCLSLCVCVTISYCMQVPSIVGDRWVFLINRIEILDFVCVHFIIDRLGKIISQSFFPCLSIHPLQKLWNDIDEIDLPHNFFFISFTTNAVCVFVDLCELRVFFLNSSSDVSICVCV